MSAEPDNPPARRSIRSYALRAGRITVGQRRALAELWPRYGIDAGAGALDFPAIFGRDAPRVMEIGFGDGELLAAMAAAEPGLDHIGVEVHEPGIGHCLLLLEKLGLTNVRLVRQDAVAVLADRVADASLAGVNLFFPDPWPKKRHHKRRIVRPDVVRLVARRLMPGGEFRVATDWAPYAAHIEEVMAAEPAFEPLGPAGAGRLPTKFERRGRRLGHDVYERAWRRCTRLPG